MSNTLLNMGYTGPFDRPWMHFKTETGYKTLWGRCPQIRAERAVRKLVRVFSEAQQSEVAVLAERGGARYRVSCPYNSLYYTHMCLLFMLTRERMEQRGFPFVDTWPAKHRPKRDSFLSSLNSGSLDVKLPEEPANAQ